MAAATILPAMEVTMLEVHAHRTVADITGMSAAIIDMEPIRVAEGINLNCTHYNLRMWAF